MPNLLVYCRQCGTGIHADALRCTQCGAVQLNSISGKNKVTAGVLALLLGGFGIHKFYLGAWGWGIVYLLFSMSFLPAFVALIEGIRYLTLTDEVFAQKAVDTHGPFSFLW